MGEQWKKVSSEDGERLVYLIGLSGAAEAPVRMELYFSNNLSC